MTRRNAWRAATLAAPAALASLSGCAYFPLPSGATEQAKSSYQMWVFFGWTGLGVAVIVYALIFWCVVRYRQRRDDVGLPKQFRRNNVMEIVYTVVPFALVSLLFGVTYAAERHIETISPKPDLVVDVSGFRWSWRFAYPAYGVAVNGTRSRDPELVLPLGETVRMNVTSLDVDHSFWIPEFLFKRDAIPGLRSVFDLTPDKLGTFRGECGEYCGLEHAKMLFSVRVVTPSEFAAWTARERAHPQAAVGAGA